MSTLKRSEIMGELVAKCMGKVLIMLDLNIPLYCRAMPAALPGGFQAWLSQWITSFFAHHSVSQLEYLEHH